jgi:hypothetical protein
VLGSSSQRIERPFFVVVLAINAITTYKLTRGMARQFWVMWGAIQSDAAYAGESMIDRGSADGNDETQRRGAFGHSPRAS